jgi:threonine/homoserine/homoserine lactone efflux protein
VELLVVGLGLGLAAGISPGPLLTLVIASSLERGLAAGLRVAVAPALTDAPIVLLALLVLKDLPESLLIALGALGGCLVIYLGVRLLRSGAATAAPQASERAPSRDLWQGALVNFLNPHAWLAWFTVLGPVLLEAWRESPARGVCFIVGFLAAIVGSKATIAWLVARSRRRLSEAWLGRLLRISGWLLVVLGGLLAGRAAGRTVGRGTAVGATPTKRRS